MQVVRRVPARRSSSQHPRERGPRDRQRAEAGDVLNQEVGGEECQQADARPGEVRPELRQLPPGLEDDQHAGVRERYDHAAQQLSQRIGMRDRTDEGRRVVRRSTATTIIQPAAVTASVPANGKFPTRTMAQLPRTYVAADQIRQDDGHP
jgi:hypothetical protein